MQARIKLLASLIFIVLTLVPNATVATVAGGVKSGDWIEYQVNITGSMQDHDAKWARIDVVDTQGPVIETNMTTQFTNGTYIYENITLNLETGQLGDDFFIPANLSAGDIFFDAHQGNITITGSEQKTYAGAERTVISGHTLETTFYWDQQTGILLEAYSSYPTINFTMKTVTAKTNLWQPQTSATEQLIVYAAVGTVAILIAVGGLLFRRRKSGKMAV
jgi:LPXTG-motif cell wall-anchored protein